MRCSSGSSVPWFVCRSKAHAAGPQVKAASRVRCKATSDQDGQEHELSMALPVVEPGCDWRDFRAQLVAMNRSTTPSEPVSSWAHVISQPELGCVLVANPLMFTDMQTYFDRSIIFIVSHERDHTAGLIINKPSNVCLGEFECSSPLLPMFAENRLFFGGDVGESIMQMMHSRAVEGSQEVRPGVYLGGTDAVTALIAQGEMQPSEVKWLTRYAGWGPGQLEAECKHNVWFPASVSSNVVLKNVEGDGHALWHEVMELLGGEYKKVSDQVKEIRNQGGSRTFQKRPSQVDGDLPRE